VQRHAVSLQPAGAHTPVSVSTLLAVSITFLLGEVPQLHSSLVAHGHGILDADVFPCLQKSSDEKGGVLRVKGGDRKSFKSVSLQERTVCLSVVEDTLPPKTTHIITLSSYRFTLSAALQ